MRSSLARLLLVISIGSMVALAVLGGYVVAIQSDLPGIVAPTQPTFTRLPSQAPSYKSGPSKQLIRTSNGGEFPAKTYKDETNPAATPPPR